MQHARQPGDMRQRPVVACSGRATSPLRHRQEGNLCAVTQFRLYDIYVVSLTPTAVYSVVLREVSPSASALLR